MTTTLFPLKTGEVEVVVYESNPTPGGHAHTEWVTDDKGQRVRVYVCMCVCVGGGGWECRALVLRRYGGPHQSYEEARRGLRSIDQPTNHANTQVACDCGFMVFNHQNYPNMVELFAELGVEDEVRRREGGRGKEKKRRGRGWGVVWAFVLYFI